METLSRQLLLASPLFVLVALGYAAMRVLKWPKEMAEALNRFVFVLAIPVMLFRMMSDLSRLPPVDVRLLIAFFGGSLGVFALARLLAWKCFGLDGRSQSLFALGAIFSNNVLLGLPLARMVIGDEALPSVALVLTFNALLLWTLVTVSVEWSTHGAFSLAGLGNTVKRTLANPVIAAILAGSAFGMLGLSLPGAVDLPLEMISKTATPLALIALGMGLAEYGIGDRWPISTAIAALKLLVQPLAVWGLAVLLGLPPLETRVVVLLASIAVGANVYLMSRHFRTLEGPIAGSLVISTVLATVSIPSVLAGLDFAAAMTR